MKLQRRLAQLALCFLGMIGTARGEPPAANAEVKGRAPEAVIELVRLGSSLVNGIRMPIPTTRHEGIACVVQSSAGVLEAFLRLPRESRLVVGISAAVPGSEFSIEAVSDDYSKTLRGDRQGDEWRASLGEFDDRPIKLRFISRSSGPLLWGNPRVVGVPAPRAPLLKLGPILEERPLNVVLYLIDTLRADRLSLFGYARRTSPKVDELAESGIVFTNAYSPGSYTLPSISSLFASRMPSVAGHLSREGPVKETLAESFQNAGYATAGFQANTLVGVFFEEFSRGFDLYRLYNRQKTDSGYGFVQASTLRVGAMKWIRAHANEPFFLFIQSMDVHGPRTAPSRFEEMFRQTPRVPEPEGQIHRPADKRLSDIYDGRIAYQDQEIGKLVERIRALGLPNETAIIITSDHGEPLGERGHVLHGETLFEELVHIPLIMLLPGEAARRISEIVSIMDLGPTLIDIAGIPKPEGLVGRSMLEPRDGLSLPTAHGELMKPKTFEIQGWYVRQGDWKLIMNSEGERLFHLPSDPSEDIDKSGEFPITAGYLASLAWNESPALRSASKQQISIDPEKAREMERELRAIGYIE